jgi:putative DNA primase/helicase
MRPFSDAPKEWPRLAAFHRRLAVLLEQRLPMDSDGGLAPPLLALGPAAKAAWVAYHDGIEAMLVIGGELYDVRDVASKSADNATRLAALFQLFADETSSGIGEEAFESASAIAAWHLNEARRFLGEFAFPPELMDAAQLDHWLRLWCAREQVGSVSTKKIQQYGPGALRDKSVLDAALRELEEAGRVRITQDGRRRMVEVNPALLVAKGEQ